ncbi:hypothetical protein [Spirosoma telluris]
MKELVTNLDQHEIEKPTRAQLISELKEAIQELKAVEQALSKLGL